MDIEKYFRSISLELEALKDRVRCFINSQHWLTDGEWKESVLRQIISRNCPKNISVGRGFILTEHSCSTQIDILLYDNTLPVIYRDGDLVFIQPSACRAIIEVKSTFSAGNYSDAVTSIARVAELIKNSEPEINLFVGVFIYETGQNTHRNLLQTLKTQTDSNIHKTINHVCIGKNNFIKFWDVNPEDGSQDYERWHLYRLQNLSFGYFIHNLMSYLANHNLVRNERIWFPRESKENRIEDQLAREQNEA